MMVKVEPDVDLSSSGTTTSNTSNNNSSSSHNSGSHSGSIIISNNSGSSAGILAPIGTSSSVLQQLHGSNNSSAVVGNHSLHVSNNNSSSSNSVVVGIGSGIVGIGGGGAGLAVGSGSQGGPGSGGIISGAGVVAGAVSIGQNACIGLTGRVEMKLVEPVVASFRVAKLFRENTERINSIDFSPNGETLITSSDDDSIVIYDCEKGTMKRTLNSKKYGVDLIHYTHADNTAIHSSNKVDDTIRYLSLHDNKYIRYFPGHTKKVVTLCMSPVDDTFLSGSLDRTIRLWDLKSNNCQGLMHLLGRPVANFDPEGLIFAVGINSESVKLYDLRSFDKGPFNTFKLPAEVAADWTGLKFSPDGKLIMIFTNGSVIHLIDSFTGAPLQTLTGHLNSKGIPLEASFSPDSQFVFSGGTDGRIHVWNATNGNRVSILSHVDHNQPVQCIQFNPKYMLLASACSNMAFWVPPYTPASDE